jgi:hypothetical protein
MMERKRNGACPLSFIPLKNRQAIIPQQKPVLWR